MIVADNKTIAATTTNGTFSFPSYYMSTAADTTISNYIMDRIDEMRGVENVKEQTVHKETKTLVVPPVCEVESYNERAVKVTFADGTYTRSVCSAGDTFSLDIGITICVLKKLLSNGDKDGKSGTRAYNKLIRDVHGIMESNEKAKEDARKALEARKAKQARLNQKRLERLMRERNAYIADIAEGVGMALREREDHA